jgi:trigger factor
MGHIFCTQVLKLTHSKVEIQFEKKENSSALLTISMAPADYMTDYQSKIKDYTKRAHFKGFRPGKVPPALVEKMYGPALKSDAISSVLNKSIDKYLRDNSIDVLGDLISQENTTETSPEAENENLTFAFRLAMRPEIRIPALADIHLSIPEILVEESKMEKFIDDLRQRFGNRNEAEMISEGDLIKGKLRAEDGSFETDSAFPFSRIRDNWQGSFTGKAKGSTISFPIEEVFEADEIKYVTNTFKEKDRKFSGPFSLEITGIEHTEPAEMDSHFFDKAVGAGKAETEEEFRLKIKEMFQNTYEGESIAYFEMAVEKYLMDNCPVILAEDVISEVIARRSEGKMSEAERVDFIPRYIRSMKMSLIKSRIAEENNLVISEEDLLAAARKQISADFQHMGYGNPGEEFLERYAVSYLEDKERNNRDRMAEKSLSGKIASLLIEKGKIGRHSVSIDEFNQLVEELN